MKKYLKRGNTWTLTLTITEDGEAMDCMDYTAKMWIKETLKETAPEIQELDINWIDRAGGIGYFNITHSMSSGMLGLYWYEIILYETINNEIVWTLVQDKLIIRETLEANL